MKIEALLVAKNLGGQAVDSTKIENYMGFDFTTGPDLIDKFKHHLLDSHYIDHLMSEVEAIGPYEGGFEVITAELATYTAKALIQVFLAKTPKVLCFWRFGLFQKTISSAFHAGNRGSNPLGDAGKINKLSVYRKAADGADGSTDGFFVFRSQRSFLSSIRSKAVPATFRDDSDDKPSIAPRTPFCPRPPKYPSVVLGFLCRSTV